MKRETGWLLVVAWLIGLVMLLTAGIYDGPLAEPALALVLLCAGVLGVYFVRLLRRAPSAATPARVPLVAALVGLVVFAVAIFADRRLLIDTDAVPRIIHGIELAQLALLASYVPAILWKRSEPRAWVEGRFALFTIFFVVGGASVLALSPHPHIDVFTFHTEGARALLHGENPYLLEMRETGPTKLTLGFVYPPTPAYLSLIALVLGGDVRWAQLTAILATGLAMRFLARGGWSARDDRAGSALLEDAPSLMLWLTPKAFFFIEQGWNDVFPVSFVALSLLAHARGRKRLSALLLGVALSSKQTMVLLVPLALLLGFQLVEWGIFLGTAAILIVPLALWNYPAFHHMVVLLQGQLPPRPDGLTPMNWLYRHFGIVPRGGTGILLAVVTSAMAAWRAPRSRRAFALSAATVFFGFYVFNKWTFLNYYFFLTGLAALAAAVTAGERSESAPQG
ncbi:glycosyltransferase 87 family protein [Pendulispora albinea]|uniref:DUF2029 domain-containing protein n=1 Tax=Pendulispora albinea TaxID=2741071 RepID=A0ABZ2LZ49_9BACT